MSANTVAALLAVAATTATALGRQHVDEPRADGNRRLVTVNTSLDAFAARTGGYNGPDIVFGREDFESISADRLTIWAAGQQLDQIAAAGFKWTAAEDIGAASFAAEKSRRYMDKSGEEPDWTECENSHTHTTTTTHWPAFVPAWSLILLLSPPGTDERAGGADCGYECMSARMSAMADEGGCAYDFDLSSIGQTVEGREIWVVTVGDSAAALPKVLMVRRPEPPMCRPETAAQRC